MIKILQEIVAGTRATAHTRRERSGFLRREAARMIEDAHKVEADAAQLELAADQIETLIRRQS